MVPNIEKLAIQQTVLEQTAVIVKYKFIVFPEIIENEYFANISLIFNDLWN